MVELLNLAIIKPNGDDDCAVWFFEIKDVTSTFINYQDVYNGRFTADKRWHIAKGYIVNLMGEMSYIEQPGHDLHQSNLWYYILPKME
ncbi:MAG: hypothetical protein WC783_00505 [Candidatus Paceibacterota bacterium]|jgi:hypothetical protein